MFSFLFGRSSKDRGSKVSARKREPKFEGLEDRTVPATFLVTNSGDAGEGTLRDAVAKANAAGGADVIQVSIEGYGEAVQLTLNSGELAVTDDLTVIGQGMDNTVVSGSRVQRVFNVETAGVTLKLQDMTIYQGVVQGEGGAVRVAGARLEATKVNFLQNQADKGGAIAVLDANGAAGEVYLDGAIFNRNLAGSKGGGLYVNSTLTPASGAHAVIGGTNFAYNTSNSPTGGGAGLAVESGTVNVQGSSFVLNASQGSGGAIESGANSSVTVLGSTLHQNSANSGFGGGGILANGSLLIANSTVTANSDTSGQNAGGVRQMGPNSLVLTSTIVAENTGNSTATSADLRTDIAITSDGRNLVGKSSGVNGLLGSDLVNVDPKLGPAQYNGGATATRVPLEGSPVIGKGANQYGLTTDQRGAGYARTTQGAVDIGAVQFDSANAAPAMEIYSIPAVTIDSSATAYDFIVKFSDDEAVSVSTIDANDFIVTGPNGYSQKATLVQTDVTTNGSPVYAQYRVTPPGGTWSPLTNGVYTISLQSNQVFDADGRPVVGQTLGTFEVAVYGDQVGYLQGLYTSVLGRTIDADSLQGYTDRLNSGESRASIAEEVWNSKEHRILQVSAYYQGILGRAADETGLAYWTEQLMNGVSEEDVTAAILASEEYQQGKGAGATLTNNLYTTLFGQQADAAAAEYASHLESGSKSAKEIAKELATSAERVDLDVDALYENVLLRNPDVEGRTEWTKKVKDGGGISEAAVAMLASDEYFKLHGSKV